MPGESKSSDFHIVARQARKVADVTSSLFGSFRVLARAEAIVSC